MTLTNDGSYIKPAAVDLTVAATQERNSRPARRLALWLGVGAALVVAFGVLFLFFPRSLFEPSDPGAAAPVAPRAAGVPEPVDTRENTPGGAATGDAPWRKAQKFALRQESQEILGQLLEAQQSLEERGVTVWGEREYNRALARAKSGDAEYSRQNYAQANEQYTQALAILTELSQGLEKLYAETMEAGADALFAGDAAAAGEAFTIALAIDPLDRIALAGMERIGTLDQVMALIDEGDALLRDGKAGQARAVYEQALEIDRASTRAEQQLRLAQKQVNDDQFEQAMSSGFRLLEQGDFDKAQQAFSGALALKPGSRDARNGLEQATQRGVAGKIRALLLQAGTAEANEDWQGAVSAYEDALALDENLTNAREGKQHATLRNEIHNKLEQILADQSRLFDQAVFDEVGRFRDRIRALSNPGPTLSAQLQRLDQLLGVAAKPVAVQLHSDNLTLVTLYKVGELGYFASKNLSLRPGHYVAVGHRDGYRDVRVEFFVDPDKPMQPVVVSSSEKIASRK